MTPFLKGCPASWRSRCRKVSPAMNMILPILSFLCGVMLTETASGSSGEGKPSPGVVQELWFGIPGASVKDLTHRKIFETAAPDIRTISNLDVETRGTGTGPVTQPF